MGARIADAMVVGTRGQRIPYLFTALILLQNEMSNKYVIAVTACISFVQKALHHYSITLQALQY